MDITLSTLVPTTEAAQRPLGNNAKSSSPKAARAQRFQALSQARHWLMATASRLGVMPDKHCRTAVCRYVRRADMVGVHFSALHQSAHYGNLATCGSVWACPVCCALIQQRRRVEVAAFVDWTYAQGHQAQMVTLTFPHTRFDSLGDLLSKQRLAFKRLRAGKAWQSFKSRYGYVGLIRSLELTHGQNGWHPHTHELWATRPLSPSERVQFLEEIIGAWLKACRAAGLVDDSDPSALRAFLARGVDVRFSASSSDYLVKQDSSRAWGVDREIATASSKSGRRSGVHPHEFLVRQAPGDAQRYQEYVQAMKGQRQLYWSSRLKALVGLDDVSDEQIADQQIEPAELLGMLSADEWRAVRGNDARAELLDAAESGGWSAVLSLLVSLGCDLPLYHLQHLSPVYSKPSGAS